MHLEKKSLLKKLLDQGVFPAKSSLEKFENCVKSLLLEKISEECDIKLLSPETHGKVAQAARNFKYKMCNLWEDKKVVRRPDRLLLHTNGEFSITVERDMPPAEPSRGQGRPPLAFEEKGVRAKQKEAASIAKNQDDHALLQVHRLVKMYSQKL